MIIPRIGRVIMTWYKFFFKIRVSFDILIIRNKVFLESSRSIERHIDVVVEVIEFQIIVSSILMRSS